jgi:hypothetical protein
MIVRKVPESECSRRVRVAFDDYRFAFESSIECLRTRGIDVCRKALRDLERLRRGIESAVDAGCLVDVGDLLDSVEETLRQIAEMIGRE